MNPVNDSISSLKIAISSRYNREASERWLTAVDNAAIDWYALSTLALGANLASLLFDVVLHTPEIAIPEVIRNRLQQAYFQTATGNVLAMHELGEIVATLNAEDIPLLLLKGVALISTVFQNIATRPMVDIDLLIPFAELNKAQRLLVNRGYAPLQPPIFWDKSGLIWNQRGLIKPGEASMLIELHWNLFDNPYYATKVPIDRLYKRALPVKIDDVKSKVLSPDDMVLHLCGHSYFHHFGRLSRTAVDIAYVLTHYENVFNWNRLVENSVDSDLILPVSESLKAAKEWNAPIPEDVITELNSRRARRIERFFVRSQHSEFLKLLRKFITLPGLRLKWRFIIGYLFPSREYMTWRYGLDPTTHYTRAYMRRYANAFCSITRELFSSK